MQRPPITDSTGDVVHCVLKVVLVDESILTIAASTAELQVALTILLVMLGIILDILQVFKVCLSC